MTDPLRKRLLDKTFRYVKAGPDGRKDRVPMVGRMFHHLLVTAEAGSRDQKRMVWATCECGNAREFRANSLLSGNTKSCGCIRPPGAHGYARKGSPGYATYAAWGNMRARAAGQLSPENYADRGITVCERWLKFENFLADMGERPTPLHSLDRIDNDGPYSPENCRWATLAEQARNRRNTWLIEASGEVLCFRDWAARLGMAEGTLRRRLEAGLTIERLLEANQ